MSNTNVAVTPKNIVLVCSLMFVFVYLYIKMLLQKWLEEPGQAAVDKPGKAADKPSKEIKITSFGFKGCEVSSDKSINCLTSVAPADFLVLQDAGFPISQIGAPDPNRLLVIEPRTAAGGNKQFGMKWVVMNRAYKSNRTTDALGSAEAIGFDPLSGFKVDSTKIIPIGGEYNTGIAVVHGHFGNGRKFTIANIRPNWNGSLDTRDNLNREGLRKFIAHMKEFRTLFGGSKFVLIGRFNMKDEEVRSMAAEMNKTYGAKIYVPELPSDVYTELNQTYSLEHAITDVPGGKLEIFEKPCSIYGNAMRLTLKLTQ